MIIGIDPGTTQSAYCMLSHGMPFESATISNDELLERLRGRTDCWLTDDLLAVEMVSSYGMPVGREVFETVRWIGRFEEAWSKRGGRVQLVFRREVKLHHCGSVRANDASIRAAIVDRYGPGRQIAVGTKSKPGPCYGITGDAWSALAIALTVHGEPADTRENVHPAHSAEAMPF